MNDSCLLIVNADDFGLSVGVNHGIVAAHVNGIVTSASLMVRQPAAALAAELSKSLPEMSIGLHLDLGEWFCHDGAWEPLYEVVNMDDPRAVADELDRQLDAFRALVGRDPTHVDSHQHVHRQEPVRSAALALSAKLGVPLRHFSPEVRYCGDFYGQSGDGVAFPAGIQPERLIALIEQAAQSPGIVEMGCHPGFDERLVTMYCQERGQEVETLCDPRVRAALDAAGVKLISFAHLTQAGLPT